jgi:hypothetical protein
MVQVAERLVVIETEAGLARRQGLPEQTIILTVTRTSSVADLKMIAKQMTPDQILLVQPGQEPHAIPVERQAA